VLAVLMPQVEHLICCDGTALAEGPVAIEAGAGTVASIDISMRFDHLYPEAPPAVYDRARRWQPRVDRHMYPDYQFCLALPGVDRIDVSTHERFGVFLDRLVVYLKFQLIFDASGQWPGKEWPHGLSAYAQHAIETLQLESPELLERLWPLVSGPITGRNGPCPCGRGRKFKSCHEAAVRRVRVLRRSSNFQEIEALVRAKVTANA